MSVQSDIVPDRQEIWSSIYGAFRLACFDETGHNHFNISVVGFWHSFFAAVLVAPGYVLLASQGIIGGTESLSVWTILVHTGLYIAGWIFFPLVTFFIIDLLKLGHRYTALIVALNWAAVIETSVMILSLGLFVILPPGLAAMLAQAIVVGLVVYGWFVIKTALQTSGAMAFAFVLLSLLLSAMLHQLASRLL